MNDTPLHASIVIPAYNRAALLARLLESIARLEFDGAFEVIVVDDCSPDDTREVTERWIGEHPDLHGRYICHEVNSGPGKARNTGLFAARGEVVAFTDTDCILDPHWLTALTAPIDRAARMIGAGGRVLPLSRDTIYARYYEFQGTLEPPRPPEAPIPYLVTCNCSYVREELAGVGGFSDDIGNPGGEDVAASILLFKKGLRFAFAEDAVIQHDFRDTFASFRRTWFNYGFGCALIALRHLSHGELHPESDPRTAPNYWPVYYIRPTITGVRSTFTASAELLGRCRGRKLSLRHTVEILFLFLVERFAYYVGWRRGVAAFQLESAPQDGA